MIKVCFAAFAVVACLAGGAYGQQHGAVHALAYDAQTRGPVPIPPSERGLQTVVAESWFKRTDSLHMEFLRVDHAPA